MCVCFFRAAAAVHMRPTLVTTRRRSRALATPVQTPCAPYTVANVLLCECVCARTRSPCALSVGSARSGTNDFGDHIGYKRRVDRAPPSSRRTIHRKNFHRTLCHWLSKNRFEIVVTPHVKRRVMLRRRGRGNDNFHKTN